jgi:sulfonate transport system ATP-binding protein
MNPGPQISARGLGRRFGDRTVLDGIDLEVRAGEFLTIVGASGSGKSTLLRILAGLDPDHAGTVARAGDYAFSFQDARLLPWIKVWQNVVFGLCGGKRELRERAATALAEVHLADHLDAWPRTLSGGEAQRVALARSLIREPSILFLDEPFGALDALTRLRMQALVHNLWRARNFAVVLVTHDVEEAILLSDGVTVLSPAGLGRYLPITMERPRARIDPRFEQLRVRVLAELGVSDIDAKLSAHDGLDAREPRTAHDTLREPAL